jgi:AAA15 family ATPase/GTPase
MNEKDQIELTIKAANLALKVGVPILTFVLGFLASRFTMTKKERKDYSAKLQENSNSLLCSLNEQFERFTLALKEYASSEGSPTLTEFYKVATTGESYLGQLRMICDSILSGNIDRQAVMNTHRQNVKNAVEKTLPVFYETLRHIADKHKISYEGELRRENYESIYSVYEKFCC